MNRKMLDDSKLIQAIDKENCFHGMIVPCIIFSEVAGYCGAVCYEYTVGGKNYCYAAEVEVLDSGEYIVYNRIGGEYNSGDDKMKTMQYYNDFTLKAYRENAGVL